MLPARYHLSQFTQLYGLNLAPRWLLFAGLMGFMVFRILQNPTDIHHWGRVFWLMCVITTVVGVVFGS